MDIWQRLKLAFCATGISIQGIYNSGTLGVLGAQKKSLRFFLHSDRNTW